MSCALRRFGEADLHLGAPSGFYSSRREPNGWYELEIKENTSVANEAKSWRSIELRKKWSTGAGLDEAPRFVSVNDALSHVNKIREWIGNKHEFG
jgi:hypothetical protein